VLTHGVNYPWHHYGGDFGPTVWGPARGIRHHAPAIAAEFAALRLAGVSVVRWFVFTDARGGIRIDHHGWPAGIFPDALADLDALFELALDAGLTIVPVLFDHTLAFAASDAGGARVGGHYLWLADPEGHARLLETVVAPLASRYGTAGLRADLGAAVFAWDLLNEPDWLVSEFHPTTRVPGPIPFAVLAAWVREAIATLRRASAGPVTIGNARLRFAAWWDDPAFAFDFLQVHAYYDPDHDFDLLDTTPALLGLSAPVVVGECPAGGEVADPARRRPALPLDALTAAAVAQGFAGAWAWSWRGVDRHGAPAPEALASARALVDAANAAG